MKKNITQFSNPVKFKTSDGVFDLPTQIGKLWNIEGNYESREPFAIKNISDENVTLKVRLFGMNEFIETVFYPGWNIELVSAVQDAPSGVIQGGLL